MRFYLLGLLLALTSGCAPAPGDHHSLRTIAGVPEFVPQVRADDCAAVALASLLSHAGWQVPAAEIDAQIYDPVLQGSLLLDMENYLSRIGVEATSGRGDMTLLRTRLEAETPVLLPLDLGWGGWRRPHYVVVFGFGENSYLLHERHGKTVLLAAEELKKRWQKAGFLYLYLGSADDL